MAHADLDLATAAKAMTVLEELVAYQKRRVLDLARHIHPGLAEEDVRDHPDVRGDPTFQFEDGQLAGFVAALIALQARLVGGTLDDGDLPPSTP